jgi:hypothetical protein
MLKSNSWTARTDRALRQGWAVWVLTAWCLAATPGLAAPTRVALLNDAPGLTGLTACLAARLERSGPLVRAEALPEGLEFHLRLFGEPALLVVQAQLKPDVTGLVESHHHDGDPEAQPEAARRFFHLLRIPVGARAWVWQPAREVALCGEAADWMTGLRSRPILFERLAPGGDPR